MCERAIEKEPGPLEDVPDHRKTQGMCERAVKKCSGILENVPDWFVIQQQIKMWHVMMIIIAIMINLLSGSMVIKNARLRKQK